MNKIIAIFLIYGTVASFANGLHLPEDVKTNTAIHKHRVANKGKAILHEDPDVSQDSWYGESTGRVRPTDRMIKEHQNILDMVTDIGFSVKEDQSSLSLKMPARYNDSHGNPDVSGFMRALSLSNEIVDRHFFIYPDSKSVRVSFATTRGGFLMGYTILQSDWESSHGSVNVNIDTMNNHSSVIKDLKTSELLNKIHR